MYSKPFAQTCPSKTSVVTLVSAAVTKADKLRLDILFFGPVAAAWFDAVRKQ